MTEGNLQTRPVYSCQRKAMRQWYAIKFPGAMKQYTSFQHINISTVKQKDISFLGFRCKAHRFTIITSRTRGINIKIYRCLGIHPLQVHQFCHNKLCDSRHQLREYKWLNSLIY